MRINRCSRASDYATGVLRGSVFIVFWLAIACDDLGTGPSELRPSVVEATTGAARASLSPEGHFLLPPAEPRDGIGPILSISRAADLAEAYGRTYLDPERVLRIGTPIAERMHGGPINWADLTATGNPVGYYTLGVHRAPPDSVPEAVRVSLGPQYWIYLYDHGEVVAVAILGALATGLQMDPDGFIVDDSRTGSEFFVLGVPQASPELIPPSPERVVLDFYAGSGVRTREVPQLVQPRFNDILIPRWRLVLEEPVEFEVIESGRRASADTVFVGVGAERNEAGVWSLSRRYYRPDSIQPMQDTIRYPVRVDGEASAREVVVDFFADPPRSFEEVAVVDFGESAHQ